MAKEYGIISEPSLSSTTNQYEMGWGFKVGAEAIKIGGLRVKLPEAQTVTGHLWTNGGSLLASCVIEVKEGGKWVEAFFDSIVTLSANSSYVVSCYNTKSRYYGSTGGFKFSSKIASVQGGRHTTTQNAFPSNTEAGYIYPLIDIIIDDGFRYKESGSVEFAIDDVRDISCVKLSEIHWDCEVPDGTELKVFTKLSDGEYAECQCDCAIPCIKEKDCLTDKTLYVKVELSTTNALVSPELHDIKLKIVEESDTNILLLHLAPGTKNSFRRAVGDITVSYDGKGSLMGMGGPVMAFDVSFTPEGLLRKDNPNVSENIRVADVSISSALKGIFYTDTKTDEHVDVAAVTIECALIHIDDI